MGRMVQQGKLTVCVVDDDLSIRKALERLLRSAGYQALTYGSAEEFLSSAAALGQGLLVLDIRLPGLSGLELHEKLVSAGTNHSVIFITAHDNPEWQIRADKAGALAYLKKPLGEQALLDAVAQFIQKEVRDGRV